MSGHWRQCKRSKARCQASNKHWSMHGFALNQSRSLQSFHSYRSAVLTEWQQRQKGTRLLTCLDLSSMARFLRSLTLCCFGLLFATAIYFSFKRQPYSDTTKQGKHDLVRLVDGEVTSVDLATNATERLSSVNDRGVESLTRMSFEPGVPSQSSTATVNREATTGKPVAPLSIHLVIVMFRSASNESKLRLREQEHATVLQRNLNHPLISRIHVITADRDGMEKYFRGLDL